MVVQPTKFIELERTVMDTSATTSSKLLAHDLIAAVLNGPVPRLSTDLPLGDIAGWDSLVMVRLVVSLEEKLGRQLDDAEIESIETVGDVEKLVKASRPL